MQVKFRSGTAGDAQPCGTICFESFKAIAEQHHFPPDFPSPDIAAGLLNSILSRADVYSVIAEVDGRIVGSNLLWENAAIVQPMTLMSQGLYQKPYGAFLPSLLY